MTVHQGPPPELPGYAIIERIGNGGFADVFLYKQHSTGRNVAVKVLRSEHLSPASLAQFETEAQVMAGVSAHPYIVTIHDAGLSPDGRPYIVMEHYPQPHFGVRATGGHLGVAEVLKVSVQLCAAVETAHRADIIHRDIKPANVLTSAYGDPGLADFGIAGVQQEGGLGAVAGVSLGYAPPEVVLDEQATGSVLSDIYSLGATIYTLLAGRSPFYVPGGDNSPSTMTARITSGAALPLNRPDVPRSLGHLLHSALSAQVYNRPVSAATFGQAIQDIEQGLGLPPTPLVLVASTTASVRVDRTGDDDGTRRKPQVVDVDGEPARPNARRAGAGLGPVLVDAVSLGRSSTPTPAVSGPAIGDLDDATRRRTRNAGPPPRTVEPDGTVPRSSRTGDRSGEEPAQSDAGGSRPRWMLPAAGAAVMAVVVVAALAIGGGSGKDRVTTTTTTTFRRAAAQDPVGQAFVDPPSGVEVARVPKGGLTVTWQPPKAAAAEKGLAYRVTRTDAKHAGEDFGTTDTPVKPAKLQVPKDEISGGDTICVQVQAVIDSVISSPSPPACAGAGG